MKEVIDRYIEKFEKKGQLSIKFVGTFYILPRKKGKLYGFGEGKAIKYSKRIKFKPSVWLKDRLCK